VSTCRKFRDQIVDCSEQQLNGDQQKQLLDHLSHCAECNMEFQKLQRLFDLLGNDALTLPPRESFEAMKIAARQQVPRYRPFTVKNLARVLIPVFAAAAIFFIVLRPKNDKIEISIPVVDLIEDGEIASMTIAGILDRDTFEGILAMEDHVLPDNEEAIDEMTRSEKNEFIISLHRKYPLGT
jgi:hypothetical protein